MFYILQMLSILGSAEREKSSDVGSGQDDAVNQFTQLGLNDRDEGFDIGSRSLLRE